MGNTIQLKHTVTVISYTLFFQGCVLPKIDDSFLKYDLYYRILKSSSLNPGQETHELNDSEVALGRTISGSIDGLLSIGLRLRNTDGKEVSLNPGQTNFSIQNAQLGIYGISIQRQPLAQRCLLTNASGDSQGNVTNVTVSCSGIGEIGMGAWDTRVSQCYTNTINSAGACSNIAFPVQDGDISPTMARSFTLRGDGNIKDNVTGLIWRPCIVGLSGANCVSGAATPSNFATAQGKCGALPWRVPSIKELMSIIDFTNPTYGIDSNFPDHPGGFLLWSNRAFSSLAPAISISSSAMNFLNVSNTTLGHVQCVNDAEVATVSANFTDLGTGIIRDEVSGLEWEKCVDGLSGANCNLGVRNAQLWQNRLAYCENLTLGGFTDWRMPDIYELTSLVDFTRSALATTLDPIFVGSPYEIYHSSTTWVNDHSGNWTNSVGNFPFLPGVSVASNDKNISNPTRCVRGPVVR